MRRLRSKIKGRKLRLDTEGSWAISYGDMVTLLLAFFILFFSVDPQEMAAKAIQQSLMAKLFNLQEGINSPVMEDGKRVSPKTEIEMVKLKQWGAVAKKVGSKVLIEFPEISFFNSGQIRMTSEGKRVLQEFSQVYVPYASSHKLNVLGFADKRPVRHFNGRAFRDNLELSVLRAVSGQRLIQHAGIPLSRIRIAGYGVKRVELGEDPDSELQYLETKALALARKIVLIIEPEIDQ